MNSAAIFYSLGISYSLLFITSFHGSTVPCIIALRMTLAVFSDPTAILRSTTGG
ncbi:MAG TPA: hypothetical protein VK426_09200 [Methanobacterium sp.]|nr:hypothetical protein [Methanobacterium sp.]